MSIIINAVLSISMWTDGKLLGHICKLSLQCPIVYLLFPLAELWVSDFQFSLFEMVKVI
jgi:hypothetical protein